MSTSPLGTVVYLCKYFLADLKAGYLPIVQPGPFEMELAPGQLHISYTPTPDPSPAERGRFDISPSAGYPMSICADGYSYILMDGFLKRYGHIPVDVQGFKSLLNRKREEYFDIRNRETERQQLIIPDLLSAIRNINALTARALLLASLLDEDNLFDLDRDSVHQMFEDAIEQLDTAEDYIEQIEGVSLCLNYYFYSLCLLNKMCGVDDTTMLVFGRLGVQFNHRDWTTPQVFYRSVHPNRTYTDFGLDYTEVKLESRTTVRFIYPDHTEDRKALTIAPGDLCCDYEIADVCLHRADMLLDAVNAALCIDQYRPMLVRYNQEVST